MNTSQTAQLRTRISEILVKWNMPTRQVAIGELMSLITEACAAEREETEKAYGGCHKCFGKGYATYRYGISGAVDFGGDGFEIGPSIHMVYCSCDRGKQLHSLAERKEEHVKQNG